MLSPKHWLMPCCAAAHDGRACPGQLTSDARAWWCLELSFIMGHVGRHTTPRERQPLHCSHVRMRCANCLYCQASMPLVMHHFALKHAAVLEQHSQPYLVLCTTVTRRRLGSYYLACGLLSAQQLACIATGALQLQPAVPRFKAVVHVELAAREFRKPLPVKKRRTTSMIGAVQQPQPKPAAAVRPPSAAGSRTGQRSSAPTPNSNNGVATS